MRVHTVSLILGQSMAINPESSVIHLGVTLVHLNATGKTTILIVRALLQNINLQVDNYWDGATTISISKRERALENNHSIQPAVCIAQGLSKEEITAIQEPILLELRLR